MPRVVTDRAGFRTTAVDAPAGARIPVEVRAGVDDPFDAYRRVRGDHGVFYETTGGQDGWGYFAVDPERLVAVGEGGVFETLRSLLSGETLARGDCSVPYPCGAFGWLSYDAVRELESLPDDAVRDRDLPRLQLGVFPTVAAWEADDARDGETTLRICSCPRVRPADDADATSDEEPTPLPPDAAYDWGRETALALAEAATTGEPAAVEPAVHADELEFTADCTRAEFADRVRRVQAYIRNGDTFQANVSQRLTAPAAVHPVDAYDALRRVNPAPYSGLVEFPGVDLVSASPELLLDVDGDRLATEPIAGTRPRGADADADAALAAELTADEKERAEHAMLVDLERNDLGKVARFGSVEVSKYRRVDRYSEVMHLVSLVEGLLRPEHDLVDAVAATFPGGTITGAPKPRTMEIIDEMEATRRGPYTGSMAAFGFDGRATLNIVIRTLVRYGDEYGLRVGAGIVHDSVPDAEYAETLDKGRALVTALDTALAETRLSVEDGDG